MRGRRLFLWTGDLGIWRVCGKEMWLRSLMLNIQINVAALSSYASVKTRSLCHFKRSSMPTIQKDHLSGTWRT